MHRVRECDWLFWRVGESEYGERKIEPSRKNKDKDCNCHSSDSKSSETNYRYENLYPGRNSAFR